VTGVGTFVSAARPVSTAVEIHNIKDLIEARHQAHRSTVLSLETVSPPTEVQEGMLLARNKRVYRSSVLHFADGVPMQLEVRYVLPDFAPDYISQDFTDTTTTAYLHSIAPPTDSEHCIHALPPDDEARRRLKMTKGESALVVIRRTWVKSQITTWMRMVHPGSHFSLIGRASSMKDSAK